MGLHVDKRLKLGKPLALNLMSMEPCPIKVTKLAVKTISGNGMAIENAKTGKVTKIVVVMFLNGKTKVNLHNTNSQKNKALIGMERPLEISKRHIVPKRLSGSSLSLD